MNIRPLLEPENRPFASHPRVDRYFPAAAIEDARTRLTRSIERGDGPGLVVGSPGSGKSLLLQAIAAQYHDRFDVVLLACSQICTRRALLQAILFELGLPYHQRDEGELRLALLDQLLSDEQGADGLLLLVDEAQSLSAVLLEELRMMTNLVRAGMPRVRLVLAGAAALEETFAAPELETFSQRLAARCYLGPWGHAETIQYIRAQLAASGAEPDDVFAADAWDAIVEATDGVPRLVNQLCDRALSTADVEQRPQVDRHIVQMAWADLQQLPTPWETPAASSADGAAEVVEFGSLTDDADDVCGEVALTTADEPAVDEPATAVPFADDAAIDECQPVAPQPATVADVQLDQPPPVEEPVDEAARAEPPQEAVASDHPGPRMYVGDVDETDDPFGEQFDEEEIVLDNFVAWDAMRLEHMPQVTNTRDPLFSTRVQHAMEALDTSSSGGAASGEAAAASEESAADEPAAANAPQLESPATDDAAAEAPSDANWPPLRLAVVADTPTLQPVPLIKSSGPGVVTAVAAFDPVMPEGDMVGAQQEVAAYAAPCAVADRSDGLDAVAPTRHASVAEAPVLVIEDDAGELRARPPVRRQEYRQLFSRLRGG